MQHDNAESLFTETHFARNESSFCCCCSDSEAKRLAELQLSIAQLCARSRTQNAFQQIQVLYNGDSVLLQKGFFRSRYSLGQFSVRRLLPLNRVMIASSALLGAVLTE